MDHCLPLPVHLRIRLALLALVAITGSVLAGCGDGEEGPSPSETPTQPALPSGTPIITDDRFDYPARGYGVRIPEGWTADADILTGPDFASDAFFAPEPVETGAKASISVTLQTVEPGLTTESYLDLKMELIQVLARDEPRVSSREVAGSEAAVVEYEPRTADVRVEKTDVIFVREPYGWTITLTVPAGQREKYEGIFNGFLASYHALEE